MGPLTEAVKGKRGGRRPGAGRPKGTGHPNGSYKERQELVGMITGLSNLKYRKRLRRMFDEDITLIQTPAWRWLAQYFFGKVPDAQEEAQPGRGMVIAFLKGEVGKYDPLADRMPKALPASPDVEPELPPDPNVPALVDIPESGR